MHINNRLPLLHPEIALIPSITFLCKHRKSRGTRADESKEFMLALQSCGWLLIYSQVAQ